MRLLRNCAAALPAHHSELCGADVVQKGLQADVAVAYKVGKVLVLGNECGHLDNGADATPARRDYNELVRRAHPVQVTRMKTLHFADVRSRGL